MESSNYEESFLTYSGPFSMRIISGIGKFLVENLEASEHIKSRVYKVFIELTQNVALYSAKRIVHDSGNTIGEGLLSVKVTNENIVLTTKNRLLKEHSGILIQNCQSINKSTEDILKEKKHVLRRESTFLDTGAHIGLITICLISRNPLDFEISENGNLQYFALSTKINKK